MGAETSVQRDGRSQEDASASASAQELNAEVKATQEGGGVDSKPLQKNGQISSLSSLNGHSEDNTLAEVGQPDNVSVAQKEEAPETMDNIQDEVTPQVNGEKMEKESPDVNDISTVEEKAAEEKPDETNEVGFKKIFRFVGFKFTLKKDKSEEKDPVKLLTVKDKEGEEVSGADTAEDVKEEAATAEEKVTTEEKVVETEASTTEADKDTDKAATTEVPAEGTSAEAIDEEAKDEGAEKESETSPPSQEVSQSPFRKLFTGGLFSNLRKKASIKKSKEEEEKEAAVQEEKTETGETVDVVDEEEEKVEVEQEAKEESPALTPEEAKSDPTPEPEVAVETPAPAADTTDETKPEEEKAEVEVTSEAELLSSQEKTKAQGSPLRKLFTGAGLKKLSTKKHKSKKDAEAKLTESGEQAAEQLQFSTESADGPKPDSGASSPEDSGEHAIGVEAIQAELSQEAEGEVTSDGEKKKEGIIAWSSFKKLVTPKKRVKRSSESEDEATGEKPVKSATLSSTESTVFADKCSEEEAKEDEHTEEEPKTENTEQLVSSTEESKKKMDTSVSWEALMCMGGAKKRTRRTSDSDDEETKLEDKAPPEALEEEQEGKTVESPIITTEEAETEGEVVSSPEPLSTPPERESAWDTLKRLVMSKNKAKVEEKTEESSDQVLSDSEVPKEESSFSLRKFFPGRRKKKVEKQASTELGSGEEDSDTPAVVPLSEYDVEQVEDEQEEQAVPAVVQTKVSTEDRSPSWIPAIAEDDDKNDQLSDIPEEAENAATPKSADTTIAEDEIEDQSMQSPGALGKGSIEQRLSTAEVKSVVPAQAAETTPVPQGPQSQILEVIMEGMVKNISGIPCQTSVTVEDVPIEVTTAKTEYEPPIEHAESKTHTILEPHTCNEAMAICTGLETKEIAKVALEKPVIPTAECVVVISDALGAEVLVEDKPECLEEAIVSEDPVFGAQVHQVETIELEPAVENSVNEMPEVQTAGECHEPEIEKTAIVSTILEHPEIVQPTEMNENSFKTILVEPITPTFEETVCTKSIEVTQLAVEFKEKEVDMEQLAATEDITPVKEMIQTVSQETTYILCNTIENTIAKETEPAIPELVPAEEVAIVVEKMVLEAPFTVESEQVESNKEVVIGKASISEPIGKELIQVQEIKEEGTVVAEAVVETSIGAEVIAIIEQASEKMEEVKEEVEQTNAIEEQSMVIAQAVIQNAMDKVSEAKPEAEKPTTPTADIPAQVQAVEKIEKEIEIETEMPVITDTPVAVIFEVPAPTAKAPKSPQILHAAIQVIDTFPVQVKESLDTPIQEKKAEEGLKHAVEVKGSEEIVVVEEVVELKVESQTGGELEEVKEEQSKEEAVTQEAVTAEVKDLCEEVKLQTEATTSEAPSEENKEKMPEIHVPVQVVLQMAQMTEDLSMEKEAVVEFDSNGPVDTVAPAKATDMKADSPASQEPVSDSLPTLLEEPQTIASTEVAAPSKAAPVPDAATSPAETEKAASGKCAEVMAQVIEVIEEAVKEIEPVSTEITAAS